MLSFSIKIKNIWSLKAANFKDYLIEILKIIDVIVIEKYTV